MGYVAGDGGAIIWPQLVGFARAKEYLLLGDTLTAVEAERIGLINHAVPASDSTRASTRSSIAWRAARPRRSAGPRPA